jgi:uncharacterized membrane protein
MQFAGSHLYPAWFGLLSWAGLALSLLAALGLAPWRALLASSPRQHLLFASWLGLGLFWCMSFPLGTVLSVHPLMVGAMTIVFGWQLTILSGALVQGALVVAGMAQGGTFAADLLLTLLLPCAVVTATLHLLERFRASNLFVFLFSAAFFAPMAGIALVGTLGTCMVSATGADFGGEHGLALLLIVMFPEGFLNGTLITALAVFHPDLVRHFDDRRYFSG